MFRHQSAILRDFINDKVSLVKHVFQALVAFTSVLQIESLKAFYDVE